MTVANPPQPPATCGPHARLISLIEVLAGAAIVIGHNVYRALPNEVPILAVLALLSLRVRNGGWRWSAFGLQRPESWRRVILIAAAAATLRIALGDLVIDPVTQHFWPPAKAPEVVNEIAGNLKLTLLYLPLVWGFAAFGEELAYRGYLLNRCADVGGRSNVSFWIGIAIVAVLFGFGHFYKGPSGMVDSGIAGVILGAAYLLAKRNLWCCILAHGFIDSTGLLAAYMGWDS